MRSARAAKILASSIALCALVLVVSGGTYLLAPERDFVSAAILANAIGILTAVGSWHGALAGSRAGAPETASDWLVTFVAGTVISALFLLVDCRWQIPIAMGGTGCDFKPNFTVLLTIGAVALTAIALPSALRAWLISRWSPRFETRL